MDLSAPSSQLFNVSDAPNDKRSAVVFTPLSERTQPGVLRFPGDVAASKLIGISKRLKA